MLLIQKTKLVSCQNSFYLYLFYKKPFFYLKTVENFEKNIIKFFNNVSIVCKNLY